ncbi:hypothetical protein KRR38_32360 [Novosphingobium sp. G106]|uniref:hypothetical protein n=1 Tax=Novosphingobium sp. G106 TaxID=2849500 RepID=UPI001C2D4026|nr:hypothetical protein [Novosphingobium sp. G106]MBV1692230.1 hypothetical protein [Novosphingobium sp. G106]
MAFSYSLFLALLLLFPGFCFWAGWRVGQWTDFLSPAPDEPNSTFTLFMIVFGTLFGHLLGTAFFAVQGVWCRITDWCFVTGFDPNIYRALLRGTAGASAVPDLAFEVWLFSMLLIGASTGVFAHWISRREAVHAKADPITFGWLAPAVAAVKRGDSFVVAYVLTKTSHDGISVAYEGTVQQIALDGDQSIKLVVLNDVDRFLVRISDAGLVRLETEATPISQLQITAAEIANVALEVVQASAEDLAAVQHLDK